MQPTNFYGTNQATVVHAWDILSESEDSKDSKLSDEDGSKGLPQNKNGNSCSHKVCHQKVGFQTIWWWRGEQVIGKLKYQWINECLIWPDTVSTKIISCPWQKLNKHSPLIQATVYLSYHLHYPGNQQIDKQTIKMNKNKILDHTSLNNSYNLVTNHVLTSRFLNRNMLQFSILDGITIWYTQKWQSITVEITVTTIIIQYKPTTCIFYELKIIFNFWSSICFEGSCIYRYGIVCCTCISITYCR